MEEGLREDSDEAEEDQGKVKVVPEAVFGEFQGSAHNTIFHFFLSGEEHKIHSRMVFGHDPHNDFQREEGEEEVVDDPEDRLPCRVFKYCF